MFELGICSSIRQELGEGKAPSQLLREVASLYPDASIPDLMELIQKAFSLPYTAVQCIGGWWHDGTGELNDQQLDLLLLEAIEKARHR